MKPYQERLIALLKDTITLLCRNGLEYDQEFCVEGLLGVTLDKNDVFLIPIKELITDKGTGTDIALEDQSEKVSDSDAETNSTQVRSERSRKRRRHREQTADGGGSPKHAAFDSGTSGWDENVSQNQSQEGEDPASQDSTTQGETASKRPRQKHNPIDIKSEDVVVIKEEVDDAEFASAFHDSSMDSNTQRDGQMDFFSQPGTSQGQLGFPMEQLQGTGMPGDMQGMTSGEGDGSWLQNPGDMQHSQDWQQQKHQCNKCGKSFERKYDMRRHVEAVHLKVRYKCDICGKESSRRDHANYHRRRAHPESVVDQSTTVFNTSTWSAQSTTAQEDRDKP